MTSKKWKTDGKKHDEEIQNLYIFGYQSKIFRDDEKAMFIDQGKHLIPWMGDASLMIDRYDGRGHIYELKPYDADSVDRHHYDLSDKEKAVEKACDEERYLELHTDAMEQKFYEEEEMKRLYEAMGEGYSAVGFNYEQQPQLVQTPQIAVEEEEEDDPYETIPELQVPKGVTLPPTMKMHAIIEKTAAFVAKQGPQMEIVVATKQTNNPQFKFLHYSHELNVYYKHIVKMVKKGKYTPKPQEEYHNKKKRRSSEGPEGQHGYLHPSLGGATTEEEPVPFSSENFLESVRAKLPSGQIANTAYAKLLSNLSKHRAESPGPSVIPAAPSRVEPTESASKPKESKKRSPKSKLDSSESKTRESSQRQLGLPPVPGMDPVTLPGSNQPPPPGTVPPEPPPNHHISNTAGSEPYSSTDTHYGPLPQAASHPHPHHPPSQSHTAQTQQPFLSTATAGGTYDHYGTTYDYYHGFNHQGQQHDGYNNTAAANGQTLANDFVLNASSISSSDHINGKDHIKDFPSNIKIPSEHFQPIIDKMAQYVVRNGPEFEMMMKNKNDERFAFLQSWHEFNAYYEYKKSMFREEEGEGDDTSADSSEAGGDNQGSLKGVSFSIKAKEQEGPQMPQKRALLDDSDDEEGHLSRFRLEERAEYSRKDLGSGENSAEAEKKQAEESLKNKLALAARGKLAQAKEEEKVKAERKKKAAMFAALLKNNTDSVPSTITLPTIPSAASLSSLGGGNSRSASPAAVAVSCASSVNHSPYRNNSRSRTRSPSVVITKETYISKSRSRTPIRKSRSKRSRSRSRERRRSRSRSKRRSSRGRSRRSRSRSPRRRRGNSPPPLPSAYCVIRRSVSPKSSLLKRRSRSRSPSSRHKRSHRSRSRSPKSSKSRRSRSRSRTKRHRRSRSKSKSRSSKSKKRSKSKDRRKSKRSPKKSKPKMIPIPELTPPPTKKSSSSASESEGEVIITEDKDFNGTLFNLGSEVSQEASAANTPNRSSDSESLPAKPSENILSKVRAMLKAQREEVLREDGEIND